MSESERLISIFRSRINPPRSDSAEPRKPNILILVMWWFPIFAALMTAGWTVKTYRDTQIKEQETRIMEARKPYLTKRLDLFFDASRVAGELAAHSVNFGSEEWRKAELRFWALRWSELEMVGTPEIRNWMRELQKAIVELKEDSSNENLQHNVRWKAECVADALRKTLDLDWIEVSSKSPQPDGCFGYRDSDPRERHLASRPVPHN